MNTPDPTPEERQAILIHLAEAMSDPYYSCTELMMRVAHRYAAPFKQRAETAEKEWKEAQSRACNWAASSGGFEGDVEVLRGKLTAAESRIQMMELEISHRSDTTLLMQRRAEEAESSIRETRRVADELIEALKGVGDDRGKRTKSERVALDAYATLTKPDAGEGK